MARSGSAFLDPPAGEKRILDVVAKVPTRVSVPDPGGRAADHSLVVINVEVEWPDRAAEVRPRMLWYYEFLRRQHGLPVVPICLFLRVGLNGVGWDTYEERLWDHLLLRFEYAYIGLPALDGMTYFNGESLLGLARSALTKLPATDRARIKAEGLVRIARSQENAAKKDLLGEYFNNHLVLRPAEIPAFERLKAQLAPEEKEMVNSFEASGATRAARNIVRKLLIKKFGELPEIVLNKLYTYTVEQLEEMSVQILTAQSLKELGLTDE